MTGAHMTERDGDNLRFVCVRCSFSAFQTSTAHSLLRSVCGNEKEERFRLKYKRSLRFCFANSSSFARILLTRFSPTLLLTKLRSKTISFYVNNSMEM